MSGPSALAGVRYGTVQRFTDSRGSFRELWRASTLGSVEGTFVQANMSISATGVLRGLHVHRRQLDYWVVESGRAFVALVDIREAMAGSGPPKVETIEMGADDWAVIPAGVAHGFLALEPLHMAYLVTAEHDGTDELGFAWDDPAVGVAWPPVPATPDGRPVLSDRDRTNPPLADLLVRVGHTPS
jgi:dTDP-4-dehydrorhamnose 3,5-epimerase